MNTLDFTRITIPCARLGEEAPMPDLKGISNVQNQTVFHTDEEDELYEGYGHRSNCYPYRLQNEYSRELAPKEMTAIVLQNDKMRAVFLPEMGGRLWKLTDKTTGRDVVYCNDVLRPSNLSVRGAWFSGGVEWNMGVIGHTPLTMEQMFASYLQTEEGPILRMYSYERISGAVYQMDFWLDSDAPALNCHMSVTNPTQDVIPMYWWSNIASPMYEGGRIFVPAHKAYTQHGGAVHKANIPMDGEVDVSRYESIPTQRDYFFDLDQGAPRWIAHVDAQGYGLLHSSTDRLKSRKLFTWGQSKGGQHWQRFLTEDAGPYLEIQAGLGKTQYGCLPMAPRTTWQWTERYQAIDLNTDVNKLDFDETNEAISARLNASDVLERMECFARGIRCEQSQVIYPGLGDGVLENMTRQLRGLPPMTEHLSFRSSDCRQMYWKGYLSEHQVPNPPVNEPPAYDLSGKFWLDCLTREVEEGEPNWYIYYCLALLEEEAGRRDLALLHLDLSLTEEPSAWAWYAQAVLLQKAGEYTDSCESIREALKLYPDNAAFTKSCLQLLANAGAWQQLLDQVEALAPELARNSRVQFFKAQALYHTAHPDQALAILEADGGMELADVRECEVAVGQLWQKCKYAITGEMHEVPEKMQFDSGALPADRWDEV